MGVLGAGLASNRDYALALQVLEAQLATLRRTFPRADTLMLQIRGQIAGCYQCRNHFKMTRPTVDFGTGCYGECGQGDKAILLMRELYNSRMAIRDRDDEQTMVLANNI